MPAGDGIDSGKAGGTCKIYLSTKGTNDEDVPPELIHFLRYVENSTETFVEEMKDEQIRRLHRKVEELKKSRRLEESYMTLEELVSDLAEERAVELAEERAVELAEERAVELAEERAVELAEERVAELAEEKIARGKAEGCQLALSLVSQMIRDNLVTEIPRLSSDADFYASMLEKYHLK